MTEFPPSPLVVPLWQGSAPQSVGASENDSPNLTVFLPASSSSPRSAILICPGGGYAMLAIEHEGYNEARWFAERGIAAFVLNYRLPVHGYRHPVPLLDAQRAMRVIRSRAKEWNVNPAHLALMGFSAGGHLAATLDTHYDSGDPLAADPTDRFSSRPDYAVIVYGVVSLQDGITHQGSKDNLLGPNPDPALVAHLSNETQVTSDTPPTLLVHSVDDDVVPIENSRLMLSALQKAGVPTALHEYPTGGHGFGYGTKESKAPAGWLDRVHDWLKAQGL